MSRILAASALALSLVAGLTGAASAQSYNAPAGIPSATAPGGLTGTAAVGNLRRFEQRFERPGTATVEGVYATGSIGRARNAR